MSLNIFISSAFFDFDDYDNPIKDFIDTKFYYNLASGFTKAVNIYVRQNSAEQSDSIPIKFKIIEFLIKY